MSPLPRPEFPLGSRVIVKEPHRRHVATLLAGTVHDIVYSLDANGGIVIVYGVQVDLGLRLPCTASELYLDKRRQP